MQKQAKQFIELLVSRQLLAPEIVEELNRQLSESKNKLSTELIAKLLVDNGHLTKFQATKLVAEIRDSQPSSSESEASADDDLGFAPDAAEAEGTKSGETAGVATVFIDDDQPVDVDAPEAVEVISDVEVEAEPVAEVVELDEFADAGVNAEDESFGAAPRRPVKPVRAETPKSSPYDSFRILGVGMILALVCVAGFFLYRTLVRGDADDRLAAADGAYEQRSYETAASLYSEFTKNFTTHEKLSYARVRVALATLRNDAEGVPDPVVGLETALNLLPPIASEAGLSTQKSDLTGALIGLAEKFNDRADSKSSIADRKQLMDEMDKLLALINNPQFVGKEQYDQQAPTLQRIFEDRKRILREIGRDEELTAALAEIDQKLEAQDVLGAYEIRKQLVARYPLLTRDEGLQQRVDQATALQQTLAQPSAVNAKLIESPMEPEVGGRIVLANRTGRTATKLAGQVICVRVKGSIYGLAGDTGAVLWRQFVGRDFESYPIPVSPTPGSDVLITDAEKGLISRLNVKTGEVVWGVDLGTPVRPPVVESEGLFVTTFDGSVISLDITGGQTKWATQLPQAIPVGVAAAFNRPNLYVPAEHSNLYVLSRDNGSCVQVVYLETGEGAIAVPPVLFQGQLFVFENTTSQRAQIRIFDTDENSRVVGENQSPISIAGNIVVSPQLDRRRLIVQSDIGEIVVLDVEPSVETRKVSEIARVTGSATTPTRSWSVAENNRIWVADNRLTRLDLQVAQQKLDRSWATNDGDLFTGPIQKFGDVIVHSRRLRGNRGERVSAVDASSGDVIWSVDLGVPVTLVAKSETGSFDVVNSSGMYFGFDGKKRTIDEADANPGGGKPSMQFVDPVELDNGQTVLFNASRGNQLAVYSPTGTKLQILSVSFGSARPSCAPVAVGDYVGVGLDNGQFVLIDPTSGARVGAPYQPSLVPGRKVIWNAPVYLADSQTLIVANDQLKLARLSADGALRSLNEIDLEQALMGPLCLVGSSVCGVTSSGAGDKLVLFSTSNLQTSTPIPLPGRYTAGPFPVDGGCVVQTESKLVFLGADGQLGWTIDFPNSRLVSPPIAASGKLLLATKFGQLFVVDAKTGEVLGSLDARQAFTSPPVVAGPGRLLIGSAEGALLALPVPTTPMGGQ